MTEARTLPEFPSPAVASRLPATLASVLVALVCLPQLVAGIYLPALPEMAADLGTTGASARQTLIAYMGGSALSMLCSGLLADRFGRRPVVLAGLALLTLTTLAAMGASHLWQVDVLRFLQALGGCAGTVTARIIVRDIVAPEHRVVPLTYLSTGLAVTPAIAPLLGSLLTSNGSWRAAFMAMLAAAALTLAAVTLVVPETLKPGGAARVSATWVLHGYAAAYRDYDFRSSAITISLAWCGYFTFTLLSSVLFQEQMHMSSIGYATAYGCVMLGYVTGSTTARRLAGRWPAAQLMRTAGAWAGVMAIVLVALTQALPASAAAFTAGMTIIMTGVGAVFPAAQANSLDAAGANTGLASGAFFATQMLSGAMYGQLALMFHDSGTRSAALLVAVPCWLLAIYPILAEFPRKAHPSRLPPLDRIRRSE